MSDLLVDGLAAFRLARLVRVDGITQRPRSAVKRWAVGRHTGSYVRSGISVTAKPAHPKVLELLDCPWCVGFWSAVAVQFLPRRARLVLAASAVAGIVGTELDHE